MATLTMGVELLEAGPSSDLAEALRKDPDLQRRMCDPSFNPDAAAYFIFNYGLTQDEDRAGIVGPLPDPYGRGKFGLNLIEAFDAPRILPHNIHDEKPRRMLHTWFACLYNLWALQWQKGYIALLISRSEDHVDDGGKGDRVFSMFSRMRFAYEHLPYYVKKPINWQRMAGTCKDNEAWLIGRAPTRDAGRGSGYTRAWVDECEHLEWFDSIHAALDPACKLGKVYMGTVNGSANGVARIKKEKREGWKFYESDWWDDPAHCEGIRDTKAGPERERYGPKVSRWFVEATAGLDSEDIAQEYLRNRQRSVKAVCFYEYRKDLHVVKRPRSIAYDPKLPLWVGLDFGKARKTAAVGGQPIGDRGLRVLFDFEGTHKTAPEIARALIARIAEVAPNLDPADVTLIPDPSGLVGEQGTDVSLLDYYLSAGFESYITPPLVGPRSVELGISVVNVALMRLEIQIDESCEILTEAITNYRWPVDRITREVKRDAGPVHSMESHICDAFRYLTVTVFPIDRGYYDGFVGEDPPVRRRVNAEAENGDGDHGRYLTRDREREDGDDVFMTIAGSRRKGRVF